MKGNSLLATAVALCLLSAAPAAGSLPRRLNQAQWNAYRTAYNSYLNQTSKTVARFRFCRNSTKYNRDLSSFGRCLGTVPAQEVAQTTRLSNVLHEFERKIVGDGDCSETLATYQGGLFFWKSAVIGVERALTTHIASAAKVEGQAANAVHAAERVSSEARAFTRSCKPLAG
jgi:hypothetical protein